MHFRALVIPIGQERGDRGGVQVKNEVTGKQERVVGQN